MKHLILAVVVGGSLAACVGMPGDSIGVRRSAPVPMVPFTGAPSNTHPMMENPDAEAEEFPEEVWAYNAADAAQKCQNLADSYTKQGGGVVTVVGSPQQASRTPTQTGSYRFVCTLRAEK